MNSLENIPKIEPYILIYINEIYVQYISFVNNCQMCTFLEDISLGLSDQFTNANESSDSTIIYDNPKCAGKKSGKGQIFKCKYKDTYIISCTVCNTTKCL